MSYGKPRLIEGLKAGADLTALEGKVVKITANGVEVAATADVAVGILHCGNVANKVVEVAGLGGDALGLSGEAIVVGTELMADANGKLIAATATNRVIAIAKEAVSATDVRVEVTLVNYIK